MRKGREVLMTSGHWLQRKIFCISLIEELLEMKETTDTASVVSYLDLHLEIDNESRLRTKFSIYM
jgi:hypothetical protein